jgi:hypothetical protein
MQNSNIITSCFQSAALRHRVFFVLINLAERSLFKKYLLLHIQFTKPGTKLQARLTGEKSLMGLEFYRTDKNEL